MPCSVSDLPDFKWVKLVDQNFAKCSNAVNFFFSLYMFFPEILNRMADYTRDNGTSSMTVCQILDATRTDKHLISNETNLDTVCISKLDLSTYEHTFILETLYAAGFAVIGVIINYTGKLPIILFVLWGCASCAISLVFVTIPSFATYLYVILLACGLAINVVSASTIEIYPTSMRAMAVCISLMCGRLGSVFGSNLVGLLLDSHCQITFALSGVTLLISGLLVFMIPNISRRSSDEIVTIDHGRRASLF